MEVCNAKLIGGCGARRKRNSIMIWRKQSSPMPPTLPKTKSEERVSPQEGRRRDTVDAAAVHASCAVEDDDRITG